MRPSNHQASRVVPQLGAETQVRKHIQASGLGKKPGLRGAADPVMFVTVLHRGVNYDIGYYLATR